jgi:hypothetical protein
VGLALALLVYAIVETTGSASVTRLTHDIQQSRLRIRELQSEISYEVGQHDTAGRFSEAVLKDPAFATPDSGLVRLVIADGNAPGGGRVDDVPS